MIPGTSLPGHLQQALQRQDIPASQATIAALPHHAPSDLQVLQHADPVLQEVLAFWERKECPNPRERRLLSLPALAIVRQWSRLAVQDGVLFRRAFRPDGAEEVLQVLLSDVLKP